MNPTLLFPFFPAGRTNAQRTEIIRGILAGIQKKRTGLQTLETTFIDDLGKVRTNFYLKCGEPFAFGPLIEAHYDVSRISSENCADNTGSVCTLLDLAQEEDFHGYIAITDAEEMVSINCGATQLLKDLANAKFFSPKTVRIYCLEIVAAGKTVWTDHPSGLIENQGVADILIQTPWNHAAVLRSLGRTAACIGLGDSPKEYRRLWAFLHSSWDQFANANADDLKKFGNQLLALGKRAPISKEQIETLHKTSGASKTHVKKALHRANGNESLAEGILRYDGAAINARGHYDTWVESRALAYAQKTK